MPLPKPKGRMNTTTTFRVSIMVAAFGLGVAASGQKVPISKTGYVSKVGMPKAGLSAQDLAFMKQAAAGNTFEVRTSEIALKKSSSPFVKEFAKEMIRDHSSAFEQLKTLAMKKRMMVSKRLPAPLEAKVMMLEGLHGAAFNSAYQKAQKDAHADTAMKFKKEIETGRDSQVKNYAIIILPAVEMHQRMLATKKTEMGATKMKHGM